MTQYGKWHTFCRDSGSRGATIPVCNLFNESPARSGENATGFDGCDLIGITLNNGYLRNLGSILIAALAIVVSFFLLWRSERKKAAVGRREMQLFLLGYILIEICEIITIGGFPLAGGIRRGFTAIHIALVVSTIWILMLNGAVGYQQIEDGTPLSLGLVLISALVIFVGTGYIGLDTAYGWSGFFSDDKVLNDPNVAYALYTLYQLVPLVFLVAFFLLETWLVLRFLGEYRPMIYLTSAALLFAIAQIFQYVVSHHICDGTQGKINGGLFSTFFTLCAVVMVWVFWSSITEDDWPGTVVGGGYT